MKIWYTLWLYQRILPLYQEHQTIKQFLYCINWKGVYHSIILMVLSSIGDNQNKRQNLYCQILINEVMDCGYGPCIHWVFVEYFWTQHTRSFFNKPFQNYDVISQQPLCFEWQNWIRGKVYCLLCWCCCSPYWRSFLQHSSWPPRAAICIGSMPLLPRLYQKTVQVCW